MHYEEHSWGWDLLGYVQQDGGPVPPENNSSLLQFAAFAPPTSVGNKFLALWLNGESTYVTEQFLVMPFDCTLSLMMLSATAPILGVGQTDYTLRVGGVDTALSFSIPMGTSPYVGENLIEQVQVIQGDLVSLKFVHSVVAGLATANVFVGLQAIPPAGIIKNILQFSCSGNSPSAAVRFMFPYAGAFVGASGAARATDAPTLIPNKSGTIRNLFIRASTDPTGAGNVTYTVQVNGVNTALAVTVAQNAVPHAGQNIVNSVAVAAHDRVSLTIQHSVLPATNGVGFMGFIEFEEDP